MNCCWAYSIIAYVVTGEQVALHPQLHQLWVVACHLKSMFSEKHKLSTTDERTRVQDICTDGTNTESTLRWGVHEFSDNVQSLPAWMASVVTTLGFITWLLGFTVQLDQMVNGCLNTISVRHHYFCLQVPWSTPILPHRLHRDYWASHENYQLKEFS